MNGKYTVLVLNSGGHGSRRNMDREAAIALALFLGCAFPNYLVTVIRDEDGAAVPMPPLLPVADWKNGPQYASA